MKSFKVLIVSIAILGISACTHGQIRKTVYGNNDVVTKERKAESFTGIKVSAGIDVYLTQGNNEAISVEADISVSSAGDADINVTDKIKARASSAGDINYKGDPKYIDVHTSSAGGIHKR